jgi:DNA-3-methyladenine glycosylase I
MIKKIRCSWCLSDPLYIKYHDEEWGVPVHDDRKLFEFLILESAQAGLNWLTILKKREGYRQAFCDFDAHKVANLSDQDIQKLIENETIIRHAGKIRSAINNAQAFLKIQESFGSFDAYSWSFAKKRSTPPRKDISDLPKTTDQSDLLSKDLKKKGFQFVGSTMIYGYMQAVGMVNDHLVSCFRYQDCVHREIF